VTTEIGKTRALILSSIGGIFGALVAIFLAILFLGAFENLHSLSIVKIEITVAFGVFAMIFGAPILILFGIPVHVILSYHKVTSVWIYVGCGFAGGCLTTLLFKPFGDDPIASLVTQSILLGCFGTLASFAFWIIAVKWMRRVKQ